MFKTKQVNSWSTSSTWTVRKRYVEAAILLTTASHTGMESWKTWRQFCLLVACVAGQWRNPSCLCASHNTAYRHYQKPDCRGGGYGFVRVQFGGESKDLSGHRRGLRGIPWLHEIAINTEEFLLVLLALRRNLTKKKWFESYFVLFPCRFRRFGTIFICIVFREVFCRCLRFTY